MVGIIIFDFDGIIMIVDMINILVLLLIFYYLGEVMEGYEKLWEEIVEGYVVDYVEYIKNYVFEVKGRIMLG